jgi:3-methyladenine DNA glycosylase AlkD
VSDPTPRPRAAPGDVATQNLAGIAAAAELEFRAAGTPERAVHERAYLKSSLEHAGASLPAIRAVANRMHRDHRELGAEGTIALAHELWREPLHERRMLAALILGQNASHLVPTDLERLEPLLHEAKTWALVDVLAGDVAATVVRRHPDDPRVDVVLRRWAGDDDFWLRRTALLAHLQMFGRHGGFEGWDRFCAIADDLLDEREFFVRKAIGWVLREAGKRRPELVAGFLRPRLSRISGVSVREAVRYLEPADRDALMVVYGSRRRGPAVGSRSG